MTLIFQKSGVPKMLIGLSGKINSGKDLSFQFLHELYPSAINVKFATRLKETVAALAGVDVSYCYTRDSKTSMRIPHLQNKTLRELQQEIGTAMKTMYGDDVWINIALDNLPQDQVVIITDVRFPNEAEAIKRRGGTLIRIIRPDNKEGASDHESEVAMDNYPHFDFIILNNGTEIDLKKQLFDIFNA